MRQQSEAETGAGPELYSEAEPAGRLRGGGGAGMGGRGVGIGMIVSCIIGLLLSSSERRGLAARDL